MMKKIILRRHVITLLPDLLLFLGSLLFWIEMRMVTGHNWMLLRIVCQGAAFSLAMIAILDLIRWAGFRVVITPQYIAVQRFWFFRDEYHLSKPGVTVRMLQQGWDDLLDRGRLVILEMDGVVDTMENLGHFSRILDFPQN